LSFFARLGLVAFYIVGSYLLLAWARRRTSRWLPLAGSAVVAATIFAFVFACDYATDYLDPFEWGLAAIAGIGIAATVLLYWSVERYLLRRIPQRRVKRRQCPFCGYPVGTNERCEGCGREVVAPCTSCESPRRVGTPHCGVCGATAA
jgi:drug/metabolite transporter superfamily protein YnfA